MFAGLSGTALGYPCRKLYRDLSEETIADRIALWEEVNCEDREKLERMQVGLASEHALSGPLAEDDYEGTVRDFQLWLAAQDRL